MIAERKTLLDLFGVPDLTPSVLPWLESFLDPREAELALAMGHDPFTATRAATVLGLSPAEAEALLERAYRRGVLDREPEVRGEEPRYCLSDFYHRLDVLAAFEDPQRWQSIPAEVRGALCDWSLRRYAELKREAVERIRSGASDPPGEGTETIVLLEEVPEIIEAAELIVLTPCNCRATRLACDRPREVCLRMNEAAREAERRGWGRRIGREEARRVVEEAHRRGLMHTVAADWRRRGPEGICNCCADDCYPFRAGELLGAAGLFPAVRFRAELDRELCTGCLRCLKRCHFQAFSKRPDSGAEAAGAPGARPPVGYEPERCRGCGLCAGSCPEGALSMRRLP